MGNFLDDSVVSHIGVLLKLPDQVHGCTRNAGTGKPDLLSEWNEKEME